MSNGNDYDFIIIGSGAGGGTLAYRLAPSGKKILLIERGPYVKREKENWSTRAVNRAINSAALLWRSANDKHPNGLANGSDVVGRRPPTAARSGDGVVAGIADPGRALHDMMSSNMKSSHTGRGRRPRLQQLLGSALCLLLGSCSRSEISTVDTTEVRAKLAAIPLEEKVALTNSEWKAILSPAQFYVLRRSGTERASASGNALKHKSGFYYCAACANPLFAAETKFDSGTGWPSFWEPLRAEAVHSASGMSAIFGTEISCARCGSHLGHVFKDGPPPTGLRYCMNAVALTYRETL